VTLKTGVMMINSALIRNKLHFTVYSHRERVIYTGVIFQCFTDEINAALVSRRDSFRHV